MGQVSKHALFVHDSREQGLLTIAYIYTLHCLFLFFFLFSLPYSKRRQKIWISPDGKTKCDSVPKALNASVHLGLILRDKLPPAFQERVLTQEEIQTALKEARAQGLPEGWDVEWNAKKGCRRWISPDNKRRCECISKAVDYSLKMGWIDADSLPPASKRRRKGGSSNLDGPGALLEAA